MTMAHPYVIPLRQCLVHIQALVFSLTVEQVTGSHWLSPAYVLGAVQTVSCAVAQSNVTKMRLRKVIATT